MIEKQSDTIRSVAWCELFPWLNLVRVFRLAITLRGLVLGAVGILLTVTAWAVIAALFCPEITADAMAPASATTWLRPYAECPWTTITTPLSDPLDPTIRAYQIPPVSAPFSMFYWQKNPVVGPWAVLTQPAWSSLSARTSFALHDAVCLILCGLVGVAIWAFFGAAICRTAAVRLAADEQVGLGAAMRYACRKWPAYCAAPLLPIGGVIFATIPVLVLGWFMQANVGLVLGGILWPLVLLVGFLMAILLLGALFGFPLMWGAISAEGTDSFDALSRSYAYVFQRPLRYMFYIVVAALLGWLGWILVWHFAEGVIQLGYWAAGWGCGQGQIGSILAPGEELSRVGRFGAGMIRFWTGCVRLLAVGYLFSYFWSASAAIYFLLRHDVDATEMDEVFLDADATEQAASAAAVATDPITTGDATEGTADVSR